MRHKHYNYTYDHRAWKNLSPTQKHRNVLMLIAIYLGVPVMVWLGLYWCVWGQIPW